MANRQHTEFFCNRPEARKKSYFVYEERVTSFYEYDEDLATGDIEIDKVLFRNYSYTNHLGFNRSYGRKRSAKGVMQDLTTRLGHALDYPEYNFKRKRVCKSYWDIADGDSYAYKLQNNWKGNSKRKHQWIAK